MTSPTEQAPAAGVEAVALRPIEQLIDHACSLALGYGASGREDVRLEYLAAKAATIADLEARLRTAPTDEVVERHFREAEMAAASVSDNYALGHLTILRSDFAAIEARLRTARADTWREGRDAAVKIVVKHSNDGGSSWRLTSRVANEIRALNPPEKPHDAP